MRAPLSSVFIFFLTFSCSFSAHAQKTSKQLLQDGYKRYGLESGMIEFVGEGSMIHTKETVYFDRWGLREARYKTTEVKVGAMSQTTRSMELIDGETTTTMNLEKNKGTRIKNNLLKQIVDRSGSKDMTKASEGLMKGLGGTKVGSESVLGRDCDVWEFSSLGTKTLVWKNIALKVDSKLGGVGIVVTAKKVEESVDVPEAKFALPADAVITEAGSPQDILKGIKK